MDQQLVTETQFGESEFGKRMNYDRPKYRDPVFAVAYILHVIGVLAFAGYNWFSQWPEVKNNGPRSSSSFAYNGDANGIFMAFAACLACGVVVGFIWLEVMKRFAGTIIKFMLVLNIVVWIISALFGLLEGVMALTIIGIICAAFCALYAWCIWGRIPFANALLTISSTIVSRYQGTVFLSLAVVVFNIIWWCLAVAGILGYILVSSSCTYDEYGYYTCNSANGLVVFLLFISLYWGLQVNQNISHTTTCGVAATWYFSAVIDHKPTPAAFKRTMTTSFGSVCLGSLIVAILQAMRAMLRNAKSGRNPCLALVAYCLLACIEGLIRYFNKYAYAQCAIYGSSFVEAAKATWNLLSTKGLLAIINDDLTGLAVLCGCLVCGLVSAGVGALIVNSYYSDSRDYTDVDSILIIAAVYGFLVGYALCRCVLQVVLSAVVCLFVCFAEDPVAMQQNHESEYQMVVDAKPEWGQVYQFALGPRAPVVGNGNGNPPPTMA